MLMRLSPIVLTHLSRVAIWSNQKCPPSSLLDFKGRTDLYLDIRASFSHLRSNHLTQYLTLNVGGSFVDLNSEKVILLKVKSK